MKNRLVFIFFLVQSVSMGQKIEYPSLGLAFSVPKDFYGEETAYGYSMVDNANHRYLVIKPHAAKSIDALERHLHQSQVKISGYTFHFNRSRENIGQDVFGKSFSAFPDQGQGVNLNGYAIIVMSDKGQGISVISLTPQSRPGASPKDLALSLYRSITFSTPERDEKLAEWTKKLENKYLIAISSHYIGYSTSEFSSGGDTQTEIWLCGNQLGHFKFRSSWSGSSSSGFTGYSTDSNEIYGEWSLFYNLQRKPVLRIMDDKGNVVQFVVYYDGQKLSLNGAKFSISDHRCQ